MARCKLNLSQKVQWLLTSLLQHAIKRYRSSSYIYSPCKQSEGRLDRAALKLSLFSLIIRVMAQLILLVGNLPQPSSCACSDVETIPCVESIQRCNHGDDKLNVRKGEESPMFFRCSDGKCVYFVGSDSFGLVHQHCPLRLALKRLFYLYYF